MKIEDFSGNLERTRQPGFFLLKTEVAVSHEGRAVWAKALDMDKSEVLVGPLSKEDEDLFDPSSYRHKLVSIREVTRLRFP